MALDPLLSDVESRHSDCDKQEEVPGSLWKDRMDSDDSSSSSASSALLRAEETERVRNQSNDDPQLPLALQASYLLCGLTLSLPTIPMMYILNTKVPLPLAVLPTYGALSFMPYSFKPLYAYLSSFVPRRILLPVGWAACALTSVCWMWVPSVPWVFFVGIFSSIALAWTSFLLGLTLIDTARAISFSSGTRTTYEKAGSVFQSQAATARNAGSLMASMLTCLIFGLDRHESTTMNEALVNGIFRATAACHLINFLLVKFCQESFAPTIQFNPASEWERAEQSTPGSRPSYSALEMYRDEEEACPDTNSDDGQQPGPNSKSSFCNIGVLTIVSLQVCIICLALKQQVLDILTQYPGFVAILAAGIGMLAATFLLRLYNSETNLCSWLTREVRTCWGRDYLIGVVLILRHAVPDPSSLMYSFLYHCFQSQPVWLQVFSLVDNGVVTLSSWSYQKLFAAKFNQGQKLIAFMMVTTVIAHSLGSLHALVVNSYQEGEIPTTRSLFPWLVLGVKALTTFISEWNFLPSVVLATVSASKETPPIPDEQTDWRKTEGQTEEETPTTTLEPALSTDVAYGSYISCIDFGDQIGSILSAPLVTALGISRENNWANLETMIFICSGLGVISAGFLLLLGRPSMEDDDRLRPVFGRNGSRG